MKSANRREQKMEAYEKIESYKGMWAFQPLGTEIEVVSCGDGKHGEIQGVKAGDRLIIAGYSFDEKRSNGKMARVDFAVPEVLEQGGAHDFDPLLFDQVRTGNLPARKYAILEDLRALEVYVIEYRKVISNQIHERLVVGGHKINHKMGRVIPKYIRLFHLAGKGMVATVKVPHRATPILVEDLGEPLIDKIARPRRLPSQHFMMTAMHDRSHHVSNI
jgi:hypothetical protein